MRLAWAVPETGKGVRQIHRFSQGMDQPRPYPPHHKTPRKVLLEFINFQVGLLDMTRLIDILTTKHPFNFKRYDRLTSELDTVAGDFAEAGHDDLAEIARSANARLYELWEAVNSQETRERLEAVGENKEVRS